MSKPFNLGIKLLDMSTAVNTDQTGHAFQIFPGADSTQEYKAHIVLEQSETGITSSNDQHTSTIRIETSVDGTHYLPIMDPVITYADGTEVQLSGPVELMKYVRVRTQLAGSTKPKHKATVLLLSNRAFTAKDITSGAKVAAQ